METVLSTLLVVLPVLLLLAGLRFYPGTHSTRGSPAGSCCRPRCLRFLLALRRRPQGTFFGDSIPQGAHPGLSDEEDSTFRLHLVLLTGRTLLKRLEARLR